MFRYGGFKIFFGFLVGLVLVSGLWYSIHLQKHEARQVVNLIMLNLLTDWSTEKFLVHASQELQQHTTADQLHRMNIIFAQLGQLLDYYGAVGKSGVGWMARFQVQASFQEGIFRAIVTLVRQGGRWRIGNFYYEYTLLPLSRQASSLKVI